MTDEEFLDVVREVLGYDPLTYDGVNHASPDLEGRRIGRYVVGEPALVLAREHVGARIRSRRRTGWWCRCDCGTTKLVRHDVLVAKAVESCGCYRLEQLRLHLRGNALPRATKAVSS